MDKRLVVQEIQSYLATELKELVEGGDPATLARVQEIQSQLLMYKFLPLRPYTDADVVCAGSLIELELNGKRAFYFIVPKGGGLVTSVQGKPVQVLTPQSPLGEAVFGKSVGDWVEIAGRQDPRRYKVVGVR